MSAEPQTDAPPLGEEIHLPGPTLVPLFNAIGLALALVGITTFGWVMIIPGLLLFLGTTIRWIGHSRREMAELPAEHRH